MNIKDHNPEDQIQLPGFKKIIRSFLVSFYKTIDFISQSLSKNKFLVVILTSLGLLLGFLNSKLTHKGYRASMLVQQNMLTKKPYADILNKLNIIIKDKDAGAEKDELNLDAATLSDIQYIDSKNTNNEPLKSDTSTKTGQVFKIEVGLNKKKNMGAIETAIISYLNSRPLFKKEYDQNKITNLEKLAFINEDLKKLDTLKSQINKYYAIPSSVITFYNNEMNPADLYSQSSTLIYQKEYVEKLLNIQNQAVIIVDNLNIDRSYSLFSHVSNSIIWGLGFFLAGLFIALYKEGRKILLTTKS